jgi:hypothetical protein
MTNIPDKIDLGCGDKKPEGFYGVDVIETPSADLVQDLDEPDWDLPSDHFNVIRAIDVFEHLENPVQFMEEVHRIATSDAEITIQGPHFSSGNWHDPTHRRLLGSRTFEHFTKETKFDFYTQAKFRVEQVTITFDWSENRVYKAAASFVANRYTQLYERTFLRNLMPATNITFRLSPEK